MQRASKQKVGALVPTRTTGIYRRRKADGKDTFYVHDRSLDLPKVDMPGALSVLGDRWEATRAAVHPSPVRHGSSGRDATA